MTIQFKKINPLPVKKVRLENGITVWAIYYDRVPTISLNMIFKIGSFADPDGKAGTSDLCSEILTLGTEKMNSEEIAEMIDGLGASLSASSSWDFTQFHITGLAEDYSSFIHLLKDMVFTPTFDNNELSLLKERRTLKLMQNKDKPEVIADESFLKMLYKNNPYGNMPYGSYDSIPLISRKDVIDFHAKYYNPENTSFIVVGHISPDDVIDTIYKLFGDWKKSSEFSLPEFKIEEKGNHFYVIDRSDLTQSQIRLGHIGIVRNNPDYFPIILDNYILGGGGFSSRLMERIRAQKGYTYGITSSFSARRFPGPFTISTFTATQTTTEVIKEILYVLEDFKHNGPKQKEVFDAISFFTGSFPLKFETPSSIARQYIEIEVYGLSDDYIETYQENFSQIKKEDLNRVSNQYLFPQKMIGVIVGNKDEFLAELKSLGDVEEMGV
ncbi:MAG: hypothetical protein DRG20_05235 [Deltaproteobacteria bacterium]|nr:insulinase family protein [Deltaproteobacteria bacterium]RLA89046.1 MAG: hypothetical protein DRG20_05235 [Deltaproteobacteria bacterium]